MVKNHTYKQLQPCSQTRRDTKPKMEWSDAGKLEGYRIREYKMVKPEQVKHIQYCGNGVGIPLKANMSATKCIPLISLSSRPTGFGDENLIQFS